MYQTVHRLIFCVCIFLMEVLLSQLAMLEAKNLYSTCPGQFVTVL